VVNDTISDMLTRLRNANLAKHQIVEVPSTKMTRNIANILLEEGFIQGFEEVGESFNTKENIVSL
jgi:small subunit ribosomal protein S8